MTFILHIFRFIFSIFALDTQIIGPAFWKVGEVRDIGAGAGLGIESISYISYTRGSPMINPHFWVECIARIYYFIQTMSMLVFI